jgi:hypothetical protein
MAAKLTIDCLSTLMKVLGCLLDVAETTNYLQGFPAHRLSARSDRNYRLSARFCRNHRLSARFALMSSSTLHSFKDSIDIIFAKFATQSTVCTRMNRYSELSARFNRQSTLCTRVNKYSELSVTFDRQSTLCIRTNRNSALSARFDRQSTPCTRMNKNSSAAENVADI